MNLFNDSSKYKIMVKIVFITINFLLFFLLMNVLSISDGSISRS